MKKVEGSGVPRFRGSEVLGFRGSGGAVALAYLLFAIVMTWPLASRLGREIASDLGDPVFNCYVMMWTAGQVLAAFRGDFNAFHDYWHGNIFHPEQLTIAYSEHLTPQMLQALPVYATTGNIVLAYNLLFLSTFVLSGFGMYLFVKELTGRRSAAFIAGLAFAFAPYRMSQYSHLQVLSTYWMPLALYGLRRYFVSLRARPLVGASAALALQNLSCGYYLLFFSPFAAAYCVYEMWRRRLLGNWRVWRSLAIAALGVALVTWPFLSPYLELRKTGDVGVRSYEEAVQFSADAYAFATASENSWIWGKRVRAFPKGEGDGFSGFAILAFAAIGIVWAAVPAARRAMRGSHDSSVAFFAGATVVAALLALGPRIMWAGQRIGAGPYLWLYENVPGFDGVRVPARYLMIVALFLAVLVGFGAAAVARKKRFGPMLLIAGSLAILAEGWAGPMPTNVRMAPFGFELTARRLATGDEVSPLYRWIKGAPGKLVLIEFPFGEPAYEILSTFYAGYHRRPLVNGYSGFFPEGYLRRANFLSRIPFDLEAATKALRSSGATHAIVHEAAFADGRGHELSDWLTSIGAKVIASDGHDKLFVLNSQSR